MKITINFFLKFFVLTKGFYLHVVREQSRHGSQELVAVEHGARELPLLHQHGGDPVSVRDARKNVNN